MKKLRITVQRVDNQHREVDWPYDHVPRIGDHFCFSVGVHHVVSNVSYNAIDGGGFVTVVTVDQATDTPA
jgi:hypothetical protein